MSQGFLRHCGFVGICANNFVSIHHLLVFDVQFLIIILVLLITAEFPCCVGWLGLDMQVVIVDFSVLLFFSVITVVVSLFSVCFDKYTYVFLQLLTCCRCCFYYGRYNTKSTKQTYINTKGAKRSSITATVCE